MNLHSIDYKKLISKIFLFVKISILNFYGLWQVWKVGLVSSDAIFWEHKLLLEASNYVV